MIPEKEKVETRSEKKFASFSVDNFWKILNHQFPLTGIYSTVQYNEWMRK